MDQQKFQEAQQAYEAGDYRASAKSFLASAGKGSDGNGAAYHRAGNSLMKLRRYQDAITVYGHALRDETYERRGAVHGNLGAAYNCLGEYADAVREYEAALAEPDYATPYKAWQGAAKALVERGRVEEAAVAYRKAALDDVNPDPGRALVNLGLCFMALGRPGDAAESYKAALGFDGYQGRGKALANLGQAYTAMGEYAEAIKAFDKATEMHGHKLSPAALQSYEAARSALGDAAPADQPALQVEEPVTAVAVASAPPDTELRREPDSRAVETARAGRPVPVHERATVDGWETGDMPAPLAESPVGGWETTELQALGAEAVGAGVTASGGSDEAAVAADTLGFGDDEAVSDFFSVTDEEMKSRDREKRRAERSERRGAKGSVRTVITVIVIVVLVAAALGAALYLGFGWPTQQTTVTGLLDAYGKGSAVESYWVAVPDTDVGKEMAKIPPVKEFSIDSVVRGPMVSSVSVTVTPDKGAPLHYTITLAREGVGWKASGVDNDWRSTGGK